MSLLLIALYVDDVVVVGPGDLISPYFISALYVFVKALFTAL
jgi:hypothetical protein